MKKLALVALVVGTTSVASASPYYLEASGRASFHFGGQREPVRIRHHRVQPTGVVMSPRVVIVRDHRTNQSWEVTPCHDVHYDVSGFYDGPAGAVQLTQRGDRIDGTFGNGGIMEGYIENGKITYRWSIGDIQGLGFWYVDGRGGLIGTWGTNRGANQSDSNGGNWNLRLVSSERY